MGKRLRLAVATVLVAVPAGTGLGMLPSFAAEEAQGIRQTVGGCWTYIPQSVDSDTPTLLSERGVKSDVEPATLQPWSRLGPEGTPVGTLLDLRSSGAHAQGGERAISLSVSDGPVLDVDADASGTATAHFVVTPLDAGVDAPKESFEVQTPFESAAGQGVDGLEFEGSFAIRAGSFRVQLESLFFQSDATPEEVTVCNSQPLSEPSAPSTETGKPGVNPATVPLGTGATDEFEALAGVTLGINVVKGQQPTVTSSARAGDVLDIRVAGLESESPFRLQMTGASDLPLADESGVVAFTVDSTGKTTLSVPVPEDAPTQAVQLQLIQSTDGGDRVVNQIPLTVLAAPRVAGVEKVDDRSLAVTLGGAEWDPNSTVSVVPLAGDSPSADSALEFQVDQNGIFSAAFTLSDPETDGLSVTQQRVEGFGDLSATYALVNDVPVAGESPTPTTPAQPTSPPTAVTPPTSTVPPATAPPTSVTPPVTPPVEVPLPDELPIDDIDAPVAPEATEENLVVSEATLAGETTWGELFGGSSRRDVRILVENAGATLVSNPLVRLGVGRDGDVQPALVAAEVGDLQPGARVMVSVDVALPMASFGTYQVVGLVGESEETRFQLRWDTYPWGLIVLNLAGVALLAWGVARRRRIIAPTPLAGGADDDSASVVDLHALDEWWTRGKVARVAVPQAAALEDESESVVDLDAAEAFWAKRGSKVS